VRRAEADSVQLRRLFHVVNGGTPTSEPDNWNGGVVWVTPEDLGRNGGVRITESRRHISRAGLSSAATLVPSGSLIMSTRAPIGHIAVAGTDLAFNQGCKALVPARNVNERFFYYQLVAMRRALEAAGQGSTFSELSASTLAAIRVKCPQLDEQRRIAEFLDGEVAKLDELSRLKRELAALLPQRVSAVMHTAIANLPRNARLAYSVSWRSGGTPPKDEPAYWLGGLPWASTKDLARDELHDTADHITEEAALAHSCVVRTGSLLVATRGMALAKRLPLAVTRRPTAFNQDLKALVPPAGADVDYLRVVLRGCESEVLANVVESAHGTRRLETRHLKALRIPLPEPGIQRETVRAVRAIEQQNEAVASRLERQMEILEERRQALITAAVSGQLDPSSYRGTAVAA
jgi:type I restriction enzyme S subunit